METNRVVMATSASAASVSCTATTVQSSNSPLIHLRTQDLPSFVSLVFRVVFLCGVSHVWVLQMMYFTV